ncbi:MAG: DUF4364 family protein [Eubacteriales bacterium]|jgi:hypothetical protein|nr:DUF4364 family protein [Eubacteriales bacterium]
MPIFAQGVTKTKLTILYYLGVSKIEITREQLYRVMVENDTMNFFDFQACMHELEEDAFIAALPKSFGQVYRLSVRGADVLEQFVESLPVSLRERLERYAREHREEMLLQTQIVSDMEELPSGGYLVHLRALENNAAVMELTMRVATRDMAQRMRANWEKESEPLYATLLTTLLKSES